MSVEPIASGVKFGHATVTGGKPVVRTGKANTTDHHRMVQRDVEKLKEMFFTYHPVKKDQMLRFQTIKDSAADFAEVIMRGCPPSKDRNLALEKVREAMMWANASISCYEAHMEEERHDV